MKKQFFLISLLILLFSCFPAVSAQEDSWTCINGHDGSTGKFCTECGAPRPAAEQGYPLALHKLGYYYENGLGGTADQTEAQRW